MGEIEVAPVADLEQVRQMVNKLQETPSESCPKLSPDWCFVDSCTAERFFRVDRAQEHLHYLTDVASEALYVLDTLPQTPDDETAFPSPATSNHQSPSSLLGDQTTPELSNLLEKTSDGIVRAAKNGDLKMLKDLHGQGFSLLSIDATGQTALHHGAKYGHKDVVKYLVACAPSSILNMADNDKGQTALHKAAMTKRRSICCMLVAGGASLSLQDRQGQTPRQLALKADDQDLAAYLESQEGFQLVGDDVETVV